MAVKTVAPVVSQRAEQKSCILLACDSSSGIVEFDIAKMVIVETLPLVATRIVAAIITPQTVAILAHARGRWGRRRRR